MIVVVIICGGPTVSIWGLGSCTTAVVSMPAKVKVMVVLCAAMRLGTSAKAKRVAVNNIV